MSEADRELDEIINKWLDENITDGRTMYSYTLITALTALIERREIEARIKENQNILESKYPSKFVNVHTENRIAQLNKELK